MQTETVKAQDLEALADAVHELVDECHRLNQKLVESQQRETARDELISETIRSAEVALAEGLERMVPGSQHALSLVRAVKALYFSTPVDLRLPEASHG